MITAYLKVNVGFLLALGINCYRRESESWDTFSQAVNLQSSCVSSGSTSGMVLTLPPLGGGAMENAFHLPQSLLRRDFRWRAFTFMEKKIFLTFTYATYLMKYVYSGLTVKCYEFCLFLTYSLLLFSLPPPTSLPLFPSCLCESTPLPWEALRGWWFSMHSLSHCMQAGAKGWGQPENCWGSLWFGGTDT